MNEEWFFYRPILERGLSYAEAEQLSRYQLDKVNAAYDIKIEMEKKAINKK
ncbi:hypothetical protein [Domibacillus aminovorans]|uniref:hypothetical protein n=1 Tax=Domibacillus aminovorans TaxID=29332 RepID=UPI001470AAC4|nr:hypothetical protein [Domibacillus aminovorans]